MKWLIHVAMMVTTACTLTFNASGADGSISGVVRSAEDRDGIRGVRVRLDKSNRVAYTDKNGSYTLNNVSGGTHTLSIYAVGFADTTVAGVMVDGATTVDINLMVSQSTFDDVVVYGAFKRDEKITETPAAVTVLGEE